ncbi:MAG: HAD hydrolase-like protein [Coriobacteriia bacterium]|nr:HAD hydrolase-like protein [Coriobacteriia bacterium]
MEQRRYEVIFFDLDGTLLPMDMDEFLGKYFKLLNEYAVSIGLDAQRFSQALAGGVRAMAVDTTDRLNEEVFWTTFHELYGEDDPGIDARISEFYGTVFPHIGDGFTPNPAAARAISTLQAKGYRLFLTTMPMFPRLAVEWRCQWADVDPAAFERITTYDNSFACKPDLRYFRQNLELAGCAPEKVLMVGNNTLEDLASMELGFDAYLVTDWLLDPVGFPIETVKHGNLADFADFVEQLPPALETEA